MRFSSPENRRHPTPREIPWEEAARALLAWYRARARPLPWRLEPSPYRVVVSELMLQQTQVTTVVPYYHRFLRRFPDWSALAAASEDEVMKLWEGLGYYRRARHLHQMAKEVVARYGGELPSRIDELRELPGIGAYTAGAVASIAFGQRVPAIDGNVRRVLARLVNSDLPVDRAAGQRVLEEAAHVWIARVAPGDAGDFNQGLMELGSLLCRPRTPRCSLCPLQAWCGALAAQAVHRIPRRAGRSPEPPLQRVTALLMAAGRGAAPEREDLDDIRVLLVRRPVGVLLGGTWCLPWVEGDGDLGRALELLPGLLQGSELEGRFPGRGHFNPRTVAEFEHRFTHRKWRLQTVLVEVPLETVSSPLGREGVLRFLGSLGVDWEDFCWADGEQRRRLGLARPFRKLFQIWEGES